MLLLVVLLSLLGFAHGAAMSQAYPLPTCPCMQVSQSQCLKFDRRIQAHTLEDAIDGFNDLTLDRSVDPVWAEETCETQHCDDCRALMRRKLKTLGLVDDKPLAAYDAPVDLSNKTCDRYRFSTPEDVARKWIQSFYVLLRNEALRYPQATFDLSVASYYSSFDMRIYEIQQLLMELEEQNPSWVKEHKSGDEPKKKKNKQKTKKNTRNRRQSVGPATTDNGILGKRVTLHCETKGVTTDGAGRVPHCSHCWVWRELPENYSPRYTHELVCDSVDTSCLSGYATCSVVPHWIDVVRNDSGILSTVAIAVGQYCDCRTSVDSPLRSLVMGLGIKSVLPPIQKNAIAKG